MYAVEYKVFKGDMTSLIGIIVSDSDNHVYCIPKKDIQKYTYSNQKLDKRGYLYSGKGSNNSHIPNIKEANFNRLKPEDFKDVFTLKEAIAKIERKYGHYYVCSCSRRI